MENLVFPPEDLRSTAQRRIDADRALLENKRRGQSPLMQVETGLQRPCEAPPGLAGWVAAQVLNVPEARRDSFVAAFRRLLAAALQQRSTLLDDPRRIGALAALAGAWPHWLRDPRLWRPRTHNARRQCVSLARHLLARYEIPPWLDGVWYDDVPGAAEARNWFIHVGGGQNLRTAAGLSFPLTRAMAHHAMRAPADLFPWQALRWGQLMALGACPRVARAAALSRLGRPCPHESFWLSVCQLLARSPMADPCQAGPIVDFLFAEKFVPAGEPRVDGSDGEIGPPRPGLSMKGRTFESLLRQMRDWHRRLGRTSDGSAGLRWEPSGVPGFHCLAGEPQQRFVIVELLDSRELRAEGRFMRHCVSSYAASCRSGHCAIFSLRSAGPDLARLATIEVSPVFRAVVQARGRFNAGVGLLEQRVIRAWAGHAGLRLRVGL